MGQKTGPCLHTALRNFSGKPVIIDGEDVMPEVESARANENIFVRICIRVNGKDLPEKK